MAILSRHFVNDLQVKNHTSLRANIPYSSPSNRRVKKKHFDKDFQGRNVIDSADIPYSPSRNLTSINVTKVIEISFL